MIEGFETKISEIIENDKKSKKVRKQRKEKV